MDGCVRQGLIASLCGGAHQPFGGHDGLLRGKWLSEGVPQSLCVRNIVIAV